MAAIKEWFGAYNVIFNWFKQNYGNNAFDEYCRHIGSTCYEYVIKRFKREKLEGIKRYYQELFNKDEGKIECYMEDKKLTINIIECPAYAFLKSSSNPYFAPTDSLCKFDLIINKIIAEKSGFDFSMDECNKDGKCKWVFAECER